MFKPSKKPQEAKPGPALWTPVGIANCGVNASQIVLQWIASATSSAHCHGQICTGGDGRLEITEVEREGVEVAVVIRSALRANLVGALLEDVVRDGGDRVRAAIFQDQCVEGQ